jgi:hypothetical protein
MKTPVVEVVRRRSPRLVEPPSAPLPPAVLSALGAIVRDMRDVPRDCIRDPAELFIWLRRMAGRIEGVGRMRVVGAVPAPVRLAALPHQQSATPRDLAEAVFGASLKGAAKPVERRTITSRKGATVKVETRRAKAAGQFEMQI